DTAYQTGYESVSGFRQAFGRLFEVAPGRCRGQLPICFKRLLTPLGPMVTAATPEGVCLLEFADRRMLEAQMRRVGRSLGAIPTPGVNEHLEHLEKQLASYFAGSPQEFTVPLILPGSDFQRAVWARLRRIPRGRTVSYREIARDIGRPGAERAVGRANGDNRICIVVPCHRVIRSDGSLGGYGGGLWRKKALLAHEGALLAASDTAGLERSGPSWALPRG
ncbi:MAG: methylated-DNA--[protein]-cysteine S-methyltransferase, partial [Acidobacteriota bacterium]